MLYRVPTSTAPGSHIELNLAIRPYLRPNEGELVVFHEVSQMGLRMGPEWVLELTRIDPISDPPDWSRDVPPDRLPDPEIGSQSNGRVK